MSEFISTSEEQTFDFGVRFSQHLQPGDVVSLIGELGSGKTTFVKGLAKGLGVPNRIISPTYVVVRQHEVMNNRSGIKTLYHLDLYRLSSENDVLGIDIASLLADKSAVTLIEWPQVASTLIPQVTWEITFEDIADHTRKIHTNHFS